MSDSTPVHLLEDGDNGRRFLIYDSGEALWMTPA